MTTSTIQQQEQEEVDLQKEEAALKAEFAANKRERVELQTAFRNRGMLAQKQTLKCLF
jgi:hypothetical protein